MQNNKLMISPSLFIQENEFVERFVRASGAGGQNVNKVATAVELRFDITHSPSLPEPLRQRLLQKNDRRINNEGVLVIEAQRFRTQERNRYDARQRLVSIIASELEVAKPRIASKPSYASKQRRLEEKRERGGIKRGRSGANWD